MARETTPAIQAERLSRRHGGRWALRGLDFSIPVGRSVMVMGPNGAGKTTLVRMLGTALAPTSGVLRIFGQPAGPEVRERIAMLSHADHLYDDLSARENLAIAAHLAPREGRIEDVLAQVGLADRADDVVRSFSAGMRKRLAFARLLWKKADLVLLDEPYAGLDPAGHHFVDTLVHQLRAQGTTLVMSTHQVARGATLCEDALFLRAGKLEWMGPASEAVARAAEGDS